MSPSSRTRNKKKIIIHWLSNLLKSTRVDWPVHRATCKEMYNTFLQMCDEKHKSVYSSSQNFIEHLNTVIKDTVFNNQICMKEIYHPTYEMVYDIIHPELHHYNNTPIINYNECLLVETKCNVYFTHLIFFIISHFQSFIFIVNKTAKKPIQKSP